MCCAAVVWICFTATRILRAQEPATVAGQQTMKHTNALAGETSPYLLQHAGNPVNWYPWGEAALELAQSQNKPIFLSVGYSTCYWCHVMERESFENDSVAAVLNEHFIAIKVDREQRPDIDEQYLLATQLMTGRGGWPNSVWLTPDGRPWMAGTYFRPNQFVSVLEQLANLWREQPDVVQRQADALANAIKNALGSHHASENNLSGQALIDRSLEFIAKSFDAAHGGFGSAPKFPQHGQHRLLARAADSADDPQLINMLTRTLDAMWHGGIHDHIGGGFHRYSTDQRWFLPHFEKMLYDNAQLMTAYAEGYRHTNLLQYRNAVDDIFVWLSREMTHPEGGFYSALDSESEGEEGKFYVWTPEELQAVLGRDDADQFARIYGFETGGNFSEEATGKRTGANLPYLKQPLEEIAEVEGVAVDELASKLSSMREKLLQARSQRLRPHLDDKILASWNGLMISGLATASSSLDDPRYAAAGQRAADFILQKMSPDGSSLFRSWRNGRAELPGYLDDYAYFARGLLDLYEATGEKRWLAAARQTADAMVDRFADDRQGGFFFTGDEHGELLIRSKSLFGSGNLPLANGVAAEVLLRLSTAETIDAEQQSQYELLAKSTLDSLSGFMEKSPGASESLLIVQMMLSAQQAAVAKAGETEDKHPKVAQGAQLRQPPLTITARLSAQEVQAGQKFSVTVQVDIDPGYHLYAENPDVSFVSPSRVSLVSNTNFTAANGDASAAVEREDPVVGQRLRLYEDRVTFHIPLTTDPAASAGSTKLQFALQTQACDANRCLSARKQILELPITILSDD
jgi:uncharacterized protein